MSKGINVGYANYNPTTFNAIGRLFSSADPASARRLLDCFKRKQLKRLVKLNGAVHTAVFAPTGVGKGVSICIPFMRDCDESMVVIDPKGELVRETAAHRVKMGHRIVVIDPFGIVGGKDTFNPLLNIDPDSPSAPDEIRAVSDGIVTKDLGTEPFWRNAAESLIAFATAFVVCFGDDKDKNLRSVSKLLSDNNRRKQMIETAKTSVQWGGVLSRWAHQVDQFKDKVLASVLSVTFTHLRFIDTPLVEQCTQASSFNPCDLLRGKMTIYLVLPPEHLQSQAALLRLWISSLMMTVVKGGQSDRKVHFVLDEASSLGQMDVINQAVDQFRGFGVRLLFLYQSLGQLKKCFPNDQDQTLLSNVTQVFFGVNDPQTAEYVSNRLGEFTQVVQSGGSNTGASQTHQQGGGSVSYSSGSNHGWQLAGRKLLQTAEVFGLHPRVALTFHPGRPPIWTWLSRSYERDAAKPGTLRTIFDAFAVFAAVSILALAVTVKVTLRFL